MSVLVNATVPVTTGDLLMDTKMKSVPPSLSSYLQRQTHQEHTNCVCGVACESQHLPPTNCSRHFRHLCVPVGMTKTPHQWHQVKHKNYLRGQECLCELLFLWVLWVPDTPIPCRAQGAAFAQHEEVSLCSWALLRTPPRYSSLEMWPTNANKKQLE